jgi:acetyl esterase/lipase
MATETRAVDTYEVSETDVIYANPGGRELLARVYRPTEPAAEPFPALVYVHGGAWNLGDRMRGELATRTLAASGVIAVSLDFRQGPDFQHPLAASDIIAGVRWTKLHAPKFGADPATVGLFGSSSGGHLALLAALRPHAEEHRQTPLVDTPEDHAVDGAVRYVVAHWPVSDPHYRYRYAAEASRDELAARHLAYFGDEAAMQAASIPRILDAGEAQMLPPALIVQPGEDQNVPLEMTASLLRAYQSRGGHLEYAFFPREPHAFTYDASDATEACLALTADFIHRNAR